MKTIVFSSIKGGTGKSSNSIMFSNFLGQAGKRVLVIDMDIQNSTSFYYVNDPEEVEAYSIADAIHQGNLKSNIVKTAELDNIHIIPSSFNLVNLRSVSHMTLKRLLPQIKGEYDYCIIDVAPTWDNIVLNALYAADAIITPVILAQWDWKGACFFRDQIIQDLGEEYLAKWSLLINKFRKPRSANPENLTNQLLGLFNETFDNIIPVHIPNTTLVNQYLDFEEFVNCSSKKIKLYEAVQELTHVLTGERLCPEVF